LFSPAIEFLGTYTLCSTFSSSLVDSRN
jgi:hypothetical protein